MKLWHYYISCLALVIAFLFVANLFDYYYAWIILCMFSALSTGVFIILNKGDNKHYFGGFGEFIDKRINGKASPSNSFQYNS
jgi:hypothetical protein